MNYRILAISFLFPNRYYPFYGIFVLNRLKAIRKYCEVCVIASVPWFVFMEILPKYKNFTKIPSYELLEGLPTLHPRYFIIPKYLKWIDSISHCFATIPKIIKLKKCFNFDLVDVHWVYPDILTGYICSKLFKKRMIVTVRGKEAVCYGENSLRKKIINYFLKKANFIITNSKELKDIVIKIGYEPSNIKVIQNGVNLDRFSMMDRNLCRKEIGLPKDKKIILSVGSLIKRKGFHKVIGILPQLLKVQKNLCFCIVGSANPEGNIEMLLKKQIIDNDLEDHVKLIGSQLNDRLPYWYNAADIFCLATSGEGSPNVVLEALACGTPVVVNAVGGISEIMKKDFMGYLVDPSVEEDLQSKILASLDRQWDRVRIRKYMEKFSWERCAKQVVEVYEHVLRQ